MQTQVRKLYEMGILDASFIGLDSTPIMANTKQNNPKCLFVLRYSIYRAIQSWTVAVFCSLLSYCFSVTMRLQER